MKNLDEMRALAERAMNGNEHHTDGCELCVLCRGLLSLIPVVEAAAIQADASSTQARSYGGSSYSQNKMAHEVACGVTEQAVAAFRAANREGERPAPR